jgi:hypothetical protein
MATPSDINRVVAEMHFVLGIDDDAERDGAHTALAARIARLVAPEEIDDVIERCREQHPRGLLDQRQRPTMARA